MNTSQQSDGCTTTHEPPLLLKGSRSQRSERPEGATLQKRKCRRVERLPRTAALWIVVLTSTAWISHAHESIQGPV